MKPLTPSTPHLIIVMGIPGAGKTQFAEHFAKTFNAPYINSGEIQSLAGTDRKSAENVSIHLVKELLKSGRTFVYEGATYGQTQRLVLTKLIREANYAPLFVWVQTDSLEAKKRVLRNKTYSSEQFDAMIRAFQVPTATEKPVVISGKHTYATQVKVVLKQLAGGSRPETLEMTKPAQRPTERRSISVR